MIDQIKAYANFVLAAMMLAVLLYSHWYAYSQGKESGKAEIQAKFDAYRSNINDQVQKAKDEAAIEKQRQDAQYAKSQSDYADASHNLDIALNRLRDLKAVSRDSGVPVAGGGPGSLPTKAEDTTGADQTIIVGTDLEKTAFFAAAMSDTLQCSKLIGFVTKE